jgi:ribosomal protein S18 acetylase RimI-like enzyme
MLDRAERIVGEEFRGAVQTGAYRYLAASKGRSFRLRRLRTFDRCAVYAGEGPDGPIITEAIDVATGSIAFAVDPGHRRRRLGRAMIAAPMRRSELGFVELFEAGVEPENTARRRCVEGAGFHVRSQQPAWEGMLYYRAWNVGINADATLSA